MRMGNEGLIIGQFLGQFSVSPGSIAGESSLDVAVAVPGCVPGDCLLVNLVSDLPNSKLYQNFATCTVANVARIRYANMSVGAGDPGTHSVRIWRMGTALAPTDFLVARYGSIGPIIGRFLGTFNVDPPSVPANDSADLDVAITGVTTDDIVFATIQDALSVNISIPGVVRVPTNGTVRLRYGNATLGAVNTGPRDVSFYAVKRFNGGYARANDNPIVGLYAGQATANFASIPADETAELAVAPAVVPSGLQDGDLVLASPTQDNTANVLFINARKPAGVDQVTLGMSNMTGGAIDPALNTWRLWAFRARNVA